MAALLIRHLAWTSRTGASSLGGRMAVVGPDRRTAAAEVVEDLDLTGGRERRGLNSTGHSGSSWTGYAAKAAPEDPLAVTRRQRAEVVVAKMMRSGWAGTAAGEPRSY